MTEAAVMPALEPVLDRGAYATLAALLPPGDMLRHLATLVAGCEELQIRLGGSGDDAGRMALAHTLAGSGGLLGFTRLSAAAKLFECAMLAGAESCERATLLAALEETLPVVHGLMGGG